MNPIKLPIPITGREKFIREVYASLDEAIAGRLSRLRNEEGLRSTCASGCCHCCRFHIVTNMAEAHTLAQYIKREWNSAQIEDLRIRTQQWHAWDNSRPGRSITIPVDRRVDISRYEDCCPLLVNGRCSVYPVRPAVCRTHFVLTPPELCRAANHPERTDDPPVTLASVLTAAEPFCTIIKQHLEQAGWDYDQTLMLLPHWLGIEMGWDFGISF